MRQSEMKWLAGQRSHAPLIVLTHHYPLGVAPFRWTPDRHIPGSRWNGALLRVLREVCVPMDVPERDRQSFWDAAQAAAVRLVLCGHVHRARLDWQDGIAVGLNGQSGASWAGRTVAFYEVSAGIVTSELWQTERYPSGPG